MLINWVGGGGGRQRYVGPPPSQIIGGPGLPTPMNIASKELFLDKVVRLTLCCQINKIMVSFAKCGVCTIYWLI